jgi:general stress protein 26
MSDLAADIDRVWTLVKNIPVAMVVTHDGQGRDMRARPMAPRPAQEEGAIYFLTDADSGKAEEVHRNNTICLTLADPRRQKFLSITGCGQMIDDRDLIKRLWSVYDKAFWPDASDPRIRILRVEPESAGFWEGAGLIVTAVKLAAATVSGERMHVGANQKVEFRVDRTTGRNKATAGDP